jgi:hypothetical protein
VIVGREVVEGLEGLFLPPTRRIFPRSFMGRSAKHSLHCLHYLRIGLSSPQLGRASINLGPSPDTGFTSRRPIALPASQNALMPRRDHGQVAATANGSTRCINAAATEAMQPGERTITRKRACLAPNSGRWCPSVVHFSTETQVGRNAVFRRGRRFSCLNVGRTVSTLVADTVTHPVSLQSAAAGKRRSNRRPPAWCRLHRVAADCALLDRGAV